MSIVNTKKFVCNACDQPIIPGQKYAAVRVDDPQYDGENSPQNQYYEDNAVHYHNISDDEELDCYNGTSADDLVSDLTGISVTEAQMESAE